MSKQHILPIVLFLTVVFVIVCKPHIHQHCMQFSYTEANDCIKGHYELMFGDAR